MYSNTYTPLYTPTSPPYIMYMLLGACVKLIAEERFVATYM